MVARSALVRPIVHLEIFCRKVPEDAATAPSSLGHAAAATPASSEALLAVIEEEKQSAGGEEIASREIA